MSNKATDVHMTWQSMYCTRLQLTQFPFPPKTWQNAGDQKKGYTPFLCFVKEGWHCWESVWLTGRLGRIKFATSRFPPCGLLPKRSYLLSKPRILKYNTNKKKGLRCIVYIVSVENIWGMVRPWLMSTRPKFQHQLLRRGGIDSFNLSSSACFFPEGVSFCSLTANPLFAIPKTKLAQAVF